MAYGGLLSFFPRAARELIYLIFAGPCRFGRIARTGKFQSPILASNSTVTRCIHCKTTDVLSHDVRLHKKVVRF